MCENWLALNCRFHIVRPPLPLFLPSLVCKYITAVILRNSAHWHANWALPEPSAFPQNTIWVWALPEPSAFPQNTIWVWALPEPSAFPQNTIWAQNYKWQNRKEYKGKTNSALVPARFYSRVWFTLKSSGRWPGLFYIIVTIVVGRGQKERKWLGEEEERKRKKIA